MRHIMYASEGKHEKEKKRNGKDEMKAAAGSLLGWRALVEAAGVWAWEYQ